MLLADCSPKFARRTPADARVKRKDGDIVLLRRDEVLTNEARDLVAPQDAVLSEGATQVGYVRVAHHQ